MEIVEGGIKVTLDAVLAQRQPEHTEWTGKFDGKDHAIKGSTGADTATCARIDDHTYERAAKKGGKVLTTIREVISADGKTMTGTQTRESAQGQDVNNVTVSDKQRLIPEP